MGLAHRLILIECAAALFAIKSAGASSFTTFGSSVQPEAISNDGSLVAGRGTLQPFAFVWTEALGFKGLPLVPYTRIDLPYNGALDATPDGSMIVGWSFSYDAGEMAQWTAAGGAQGLGRFPSNPMTWGDYTIASGVSEDGKAIAGTFRSGSMTYDEVAFRWTGASAFEELGDLPGGAIGSRATDISFDGNVVIGSSLSLDGREAFRWTRATQMIGLGDLSGGAFGSEAYRVSGDGSTTVGYGRSEDGQRAFRWTEEDGMVDLGDLPGGYGSIAYAVSADGSVVVGSASAGAFIWTEALGMRSLEEVLINSYGLDLQGFHLSGATAISADGMKIAGSGGFPNAASSVGWLAVLPEPEAAVQLSAAICLIFGIRRRLIR